MLRRLVRRLQYYCCKKHSATVSTQTDFPDPNQHLRCCICLDQYSSIVLFPCNHLCLCSECCNLVLKDKKKCPLCRQVISTTQIIYTV